MSLDVSSNEISIPVSKGTYIEKPYAVDVKHKAYNLLKDVRYNGEPVVSRVIDFDGKSRLEVEELTGEDLHDFMNRKDVTLKDKIKVCFHVLGQYKAINEAGFVIGDRHGYNIRVISYVDKVSIRQMDLKSLFDYKNNIYYTSSNRKSFQLFNQLAMSSDNDLWEPAIYELLDLELKAASIDKSDDIVKILESYKNNSRADRGGFKLNDHIDTVKKILEML